MVLKIVHGNFRIDYGKFFQTLKPTANFIKNNSNGILSAKCGFNLMNSIIMNIYKSLILLFFGSLIRYSK